MKFLIVIKVIDKFSPIGPEVGPLLLNQLRWVRVLHGARENRCDIVFIRKKYTYGVLYVTI